MLPDRNSKIDSFHERGERMQKQELSILSLARRAGKLILGFDKVVEEMQNGKVKGVFFSADLSAKSRKELIFAAQKYHFTPSLLDVQMEEIGRACGKRSGVIAVCDDGFAKKLQSLSQMQLQDKSIPE